MTKSSATNEPLSPEILQAVIGIVAVYRQDRPIREAMAAAARQTPNPLPIDETQWDAYIAEARRYILLSARYDPEEELAVAITRLHDLYQAAQEAGEMKASLDAQKELNKLLRLYSVERTEESDEESADEQAARRAAVLRELDPSMADIVVAIDDALEPALTAAGHEVPAEMQYTEVIQMAAGQIKSKRRRRKKAKKKAAKKKAKKGAKKAAKKKAKKGAKKAAKKKAKKGASKAHK